MARDDEPSKWIVPTQGAKTFPAVEILTGRGFITGKSGSGKSNTASVITEELLENNYNLMIVDTEGEYYGLKEQYELLHVGNDENLCDVQVGPEHATKIATLALERNVPVILDVSDYLDADVAKELIANTVRELYVKEKDVRKPFLLMVEEMQEYLPQQGSTGELEDLLERVAKRGRKRGLGMLGMSQRPSSVDKDYITQCDWMVWHRLTWKTDLDVVRNIMGSETASEIEDLDTGEAYLMTDWDEEVERVQFKKKRTHDAGATPGLESYERPDLKSVSSELVDEIAGSAGGQQTVDDATEPEFDPVEDFEVDTVAADVEALGTPSDTTEPESSAATENGSVDEMAHDELVDLVDALRSEKTILEDEVQELRGILSDVERPPDYAKPPAQDPDTTAVSGAGAGMGASESNTPEPAQSTEPLPTPSRPEAPSRPTDRNGVSGNLIEFTAMIVYLWKSMVYRLKLLSYRIQTSDVEDGRGN